MQVALDKDNKRIHITKTHIKEDYYCPSCGEKLILRKGKIRIHHFAHKGNTTCNDEWTYDMSDWHCNWQNRFPVETQEVVKELNGKKHRADVLLEEYKIVIEFQHSPLSADEFYDRNEFYNELGYKVYWLFDETDQYDNYLIRKHETKNNIFKWTKPRNTFNYLDSVKDSNIKIFLQLIDKDFRDNDEGYIVEVSWIASSGFERFAVKNDDLSEDDFVEKFIKNIEKYSSSKYAFDSLRMLYSKDHTTYYDGCSLSTTHMCCNSIIDIPKDKYKDITPCETCKYKDLIDDEYVCYKRFNDLNLPNDTKIINILKNDDGTLKTITIENQHGQKDINFGLVQRSNIPDSIISLWNKYNPRMATFRNVSTGKFVRIYDNPQEQIKRWKKCYGKISDNQYEFNNDSMEIYYYGKSEWVMVWHK